MKPFRVFAVLLGASNLCACGGTGSATPASPAVVTLTGTFTASSLSLQGRARTAATAVGSVGAALYAGTSAAGSPIFTTCEPIANGTAVLSVTAPVGTDTIVIAAAAGSCSPAGGGAGSITTGTIVAETQTTATVSATMTTLAQAFGNGAPVVLTTPSLSPTTIVLTPSSLTFTNAGAGLAQTTIASEPDYSGGFSLSSTTCSGIAAISLSASSISVTPLAAGACTVGVRDVAGQSAFLAVGVTTTTLGGS